MTDDQQGNLENIRAGYKAAIDLWTAAASQNWSRFHAMVLVNTIIMAVIVQVFVEKVVLPYAWLIPMCGLILCGLWVLLLARGISYQDYYVASARQLEQHLAPTIVVRRGHEFGQNQEVDVGEEKRRQIPWHARVRNRAALYVAVGIFAVLYLSSLVLLARGSTAGTGPGVRGGHSLLIERSNVPSVRLEVSPPGAVTLELSDKDGKVIWKAP